MGRGNVRKWARSANFARRDQEGEQQSRYAMQSKSKRRSMQCGLHVESARWSNRTELRKCHSATAHAERTTPGWVITSFRNGASVRSQTSKRVLPSGGSNLSN